MSFVGSCGGAATRATSEPESETSSMPAAQTGFPKPSCKPRDEDDVRRRCQPCPQGAPASSGAIRRSLMGSVEYP